MRERVAYGKPAFQIKLTKSVLSIIIRFNKLIPTKKRLKLLVILSDILDILVDIDILADSCIYLSCIK